MPISLAQQRVHFNARMDGLSFQCKYDYLLTKRKVLETEAAEFEIGGVFH